MNDALCVDMTMPCTYMIIIMSRSCVFALCCLGDWHIAYLLLYSPLRLEKLKEVEGEGGGEPQGAAGESEKTTAAATEEPMDTMQSASGDKPTSS